MTGSWPSHRVEIGLTSYDSRLKRLSHDPRFILINNYKCGYSSSNKLPHWPVHTIADGDVIVFFYRSIYLRAVSIFVNWCITDARYETEDGWLFTNLGRAMTDAAYRDFLAALRGGQHPDAFGMFLENLETIAAWNDHTRPQTDVLDRYRIDRVDHFIELENNRPFRQLTGVDFPYDMANRSATPLKLSLIDVLLTEDRLRGALQEIYRKDLDFQERHNLECLPC